MTMFRELFEPMTIGPMRVVNRIMMSAMSAGMMLDKVQAGELGLAPADDAADTGPDHPADPGRGAADSVEVAAGNLDAKQGVAFVRAHRHRVRHEGRREASSGVQAGRTRRERMMRQGGKASENPVKAATPLQHSAASASPGSFSRR